MGKKGVSANLLATCLNPACKKVFSRYSMYASIGGSISMPTGGRGVPCPDCGGEYVMPAGRYVATDAGVLFHPRTDADREMANRAWDFVREALDGLIEFDDVKREAKKRAPEFSVLWDLFPDSKQDAYNFLTVVITLLGLLLGSYQAFKPDSGHGLVLPQELIDAILRAQQPHPGDTHKERPEGPQE